MTNCKGCNEALVCPRHHGVGAPSYDVPNANGLTFECWLSACGYSHPGADYETRLARMMAWYAGRSPAEMMARERR